MATAPKYKSPSCIGFRASAEECRELGTRSDEAIYGTEVPATIATKVAMHAHAEVLVAIGSGETLAQA